jgi:hypothetical protein
MTCFQHQLVSTIVPITDAEKSEYLTEADLSERSRRSKLEAVKKESSIEQKESKQGSTGEAALWEERRLTKACTGASPRAWHGRGVTTRHQPGDASR